MFGPCLFSPSITDLMKSHTPASAIQVKKPKGRKKQLKARRENF
jgi:hypothetical protein